MYIQVYICKYIQYIYSGLKQIVGDPGRVNHASWRNEEEEVHEIGWRPILECQYGRNKRASAFPQQQTESLLGTSWKPAENKLRVGWSEIFH